MNPSFHRFVAISATPAEFSTRRAATDLFNLSLTYKGGSTRTFLATHVPKALQPVINGGAADGFHMEILPVNSVASRSLVGAPEYLLLRATSSEGADISCIPGPLKRARVCRLILGGIACVAGGLLLFTPQVLAGTLVLLAGSHVLRTAREIPHSAKLVWKTCG